METLPHRRSFARPSTLELARPAVNAISRRQFLGRGSAALALAALGRRGTGALAAGPQAPSTAPAPGTPLVIDASSEQVIGTHGVRMSALEDMLDKALRRLTNADRAEDAWHAILRPDDVIGIKFNQCGAEVLGTTAPLARVLLESLRGAGFNPANVVLLEADERTAREFRTRRPDLRYPDQQHDFGCGQDSVLAALDGITAIINVPFYKTHHLAVMTGCLKNLSHGLIRRPNRFHANGCDPAIGRIVASAPIRSKMRLHLVNGLRMVVDGGSRLSDDGLAETGSIVLARDPVAADAYGFERLNEIRRERKLPPLLPLPRIPPYLATAHDLGLGQFDPERYDLVRLRL